MQSMAETTPSQRLRRNSIYDQVNANTASINNGKVLQLRAGTAIGDMNCSLQGESSCQIGGFMPLCFLGRAMPQTAPLATPVVRSAGAGEGTSGKLTEAGATYGHCF